MSARWPYPRIVAHRGGGRLAPENTLAAIRLGAALGFRGVEFDVMLAGDGTPVLMHDERSKIMNSSTFSCGESVLPMRSHSAWIAGPPFRRIAPATPPPS